MRIMLPARSAQCTAAAHLATLSSTGRPREDRAAFDEETCTDRGVHPFRQQEFELPAQQYHRAVPLAEGQAEEARMDTTDVWRCSATAFCRRACIHGVAISSELLRRRTTPRLASTNPRTPGMMKRTAAPTSSGSCKKSKTGPAERHPHC